MADKNINNSESGSSANKFNDTVKSLVDNMDSFVSAKTVLGDPVSVGDTVIIPLVDVSFGVGAGAFGKSSSGNSGGGMHGKMTPSAVLVVKDGIARVVNVKDQDMIAKLMSVAPDVVDRVSSFIKGRSDSSSADEVEKEVNKAKKDAKNEF